MKKTSRKLLVTILLGIVFFGTVLAFELVYWNRVYPGVWIAETNLGGKDRVETLEDVNKLIKKMNVLVLKWGNNRWELPLEQLGVEFDADKTVGAALTLGRGSDVKKSWESKLMAIKNNVNIEPIYVSDDNKLMATVAVIAGQINIPAKEPEVTIERPGGQILVTNGEDGQEVDERELVARIREWVRGMKNLPVEIPVLQLRPKLAESELERARKRAESLVGGKIVLDLGAEKREWLIDEEQIILWMDPQNNGWRRAEIEGWVGELAHSVDRPAQNANVRVGINGKVEEFEPAKDGYRVKPGELVELIISTLTSLEIGESREMRAGVLMATEEPQIKTGDVNNLGINELLGKGESWYAGSITNRIFNLKKAADSLNGVLVPPGEIFSFNKTVGEISSATGYKSAYIIKEGKTILGDGGGVCQTSSTLFRAILAAGLPIEERTAHAYRVSYYEQNYQPGFDATVFQPAPDFKFKNDTPGHILVQMEFDEKNKYLAFSIYGTSDGRKAEVSKSRTWDVTLPPPDLYIDDPNLPAGKIVQTEHKAPGAKVAFDWKVTRGDEVLIERTFYSNYRPWQAVYLRGTRQ